MQAHANDQDEEGHLGACLSAEIKFIFYQGDLVMHFNIYAIYNLL